MMYSCRGALNTPTYLDKLSVKNILSTELGENDMTKISCLTTIFLE